MIRGEPLSDLSKKYYRDGKATGEAEGEARGRAQGKAEGKAEGVAEALLKVLDTRALVPTRAQRKAVLACKDLPRLERWLEAALRATSVREVLRDR